MRMRRSSSTSRKPSVVTSASRAPRRSSTAFVATVVPCTTLVDRRAGGQLGHGGDDRAVVGGRRREHLRERDARPSSPTRITSVNVPPTSAPTRAPLTASRSEGSEPAIRSTAQRMLSWITRSARSGSCASHASTKSWYVADRPLEALGAREHEAVVAAAAPEQPLDLADEARPARREVRRGVELPAAVEVARRRPAPAARRSSSREQVAHPLELGRPDGRRAEARREPLEPEPRGVQLLQVLAREPADERAAVVGDLDEPGALERDERVADRRLRDAEPLGEVALHERRSLRQPAGDDQLAQRLGRALLRRRAADRLDVGEMLRADELTLDLRPLYARRPRFEISCRATLSHGDHGDQRATAASARIGVDVGGTFTDVILQRPDGRATIRKLLSTPPNYDAAVVVRGRRARRRAGRRRRTSCTGRPWRRTPCSSGAARVTALVTTAGFRDVLELRRLRIPHMYDPFWRKPEPLVPRRRRYEVNERVTADGTVLRAARRGRGARRRGAARGRRRRVGRGLPAALVPLPGPRGGARRDPARGAARASPSRSRARSCASSASTSAPRRRSSTPTSGR